LTNFKGEFFRKLIHIGSSAIPIGYYFLDRQIVLDILFPLLFLILLVEILKYRIDFAYNLYVKVFGVMLKEHETDRKLFRFTGATWVLLADVFCIVFFPKFIAITGMLILSLADSLSAVFGRLSREKHFVQDRTVTGTAVFFIVCVTISFLGPKYFYSLKEYSIYIAMCVITTISDIIPLPIDDNFAIPVISCSSLYVFYLFFLPGTF
jgi:dolichol kinase